MAKNKRAKILKTLIEVFDPGPTEDNSFFVTLADLKTAIDAAVADLPDGGRNVLLTTPTRIRGMGVAYGYGPAFDNIINLRLQVMTLGGQECAVLDLDD